MSSQKASTSTQQQSIGRYVLYGGAGVTAVVCLALSPFLVTPALPRRLYGALPYQNTPKHAIDTAIKLLCKRGLRPGSKFVDLGSGAGEATIAAAKAGFNSVGVEINPSLLFFSRLSLMSQRGKVAGSCRFQNRNLLKMQYSNYDCLFMFGVKPLIRQLEPKLEAEVKRGAYVCLYRFQMSKEMTESAFKVVGTDGEITLYERT